METPLQIVLHPEPSWKIYHLLPDHCEYKIPFARPRLITNPSGELLSQSYNGEDYWIELLSFSLHTNVALTLWLTTSVIAFTLLLQGRLESSLTEVENIHLEKGSYTAFYLPSGNKDLVLSPGEYTLLYIITPVYYLNSMAAEHLEIQNLLLQLANNSRQVYMSEKFPFPPAIIRIVKSMERCNKKGAALDLVLRSYILKLLSFYNHQLKEKKSSRFFITNREIAYAVKEHIQANIGNINLGRIKELSRQFHITPKTLDREFKLLFSKTVAVYTRDERLNKAHALLTQSGKQVQEVALETGYDYFSHFSREFKRKFGYSPVSVKKKAKP